MIKRLIGRLRQLTATRQLTVDKMTTHFRIQAVLACSCVAVEFERAFECGGCNDHTYQLCNFYLRIML